jgi:hypothetical protein
MTAKERKATRFLFEEPITAQWSNGGIHECAGITRDVSRFGIFFYSDSSPDLHTSIELVLTLPTEFTGGQPRTVFCKGRVVRVEPPSHDGGKVGIAVEVESFNDVPES